MSPVGGWGQRLSSLAMSHRVGLSDVTTGAASSSKQNATRRTARKRVVQFWDEDEGGEPSLLAGVCKPHLVPWDIPWGQCWQWELLLSKLGFSFTRFHSLLGEMDDFVINFMAKL